MDRGTARDRLIVALDTDADGARALVRELEGHVRWLKVGMTLFYQAGPAMISELREEGFDIFLDLKLHDIPHQVRGAAESISRLGVQMLTVHASGGGAMISAAVEGARTGSQAANVEAPAVVAVTVLTSMDDGSLASVGVTRTAALQVPLLAKVASEAGASGVVCSPREAAEMRDLLGEAALVVTPGVRPSWADAGDQARIQTPVQALINGASHLVVGRPITGASKPADAVKRLLDEMEEGL
ncbi:MAG TPA: orotidine-5'-phosphate decarboxylase [Coriobacteriia bacterium]|nr:orotidine-5'-phosphate decarboxylase [Coriobacteriia bacterium]